MTNILEHKHKKQDEESERIAQMIIEMIAVETKNNLATGGLVISKLSKFLVSRIIELNPDEAIQEQAITWFLDQIRSELHTIGINID